MFGMCCALAILVQHEYDTNITFMGWNPRGAEYAGYLQSALRKS